MHHREGAYRNWRLPLGEKEGETKCAEKIGEDGREEEERGGGYGGRRRPLELADGERSYHPFRTGRPVGWSVSQSAMEACNARRKRKFSERDIQSVGHSVNLGLWKLWRWRLWLWLWLWLCGFYGYAASTASMAMYVVSKFYGHAYAMCLFAPKS